jgi:hypothetical protein
VTSRNLPAFAGFALILASSCANEPEFLGETSTPVTPAGGGPAGGGSGNSTGGSTLNLGGRPHFGGTSSGGGGSCVDVEVDFTPEVPSVVPLIDQSGSMSADLGGVQRWNAVRDVLIGDEGVIPSLEDSVRFGLMLYTGPSNGNGPVCPLLTEVAPALNNHAAIAAQYDPNDWLWETPTGESVAAAAEALANEPDPRAIILATDGEPDTCAVPNPQTGQEDAKAAIAAAYDQGIVTYVLSVGSDVSEAHLREIANLGQGFPADDPTPRFYLSNDQAGLVAAFEDIINGERSCKMELNGSVVSGSEDLGAVTLNGDRLSYGTDYVLNSPSELELVGDACETVLSGSNDLNIVFPCGSIVVK